MSDLKQTGPTGSFLNRILARLPARMINDIEKRSRALLILAILLLGSLAALGMTTVRAIQEGWILATWLSLFIAISLGIILVSLQFAKRLEPVSDALVLNCALLILAIVFVDGGLTSRVLVWPPALVLLAAFIGDKFSAPRTLLLMSSGMLIILILQVNQLLANPWDEGAIIGRWIACTASMLFVLLVSHQFKAARMRAQAEYQALETERRRWLAMVSHELRTPLTVIYGSLALLENAHKHSTVESQNNNMHELLSMSKKNTERLIRMVNHILDMERLQTGQFDFDMRPIEAQQLVTEVSKFCSHIASQKQITLDIAIEDNPVIVVDEDKMIQVLLNILSNAIKFSPINSPIKIRVLQTEQHCEIHVRDFGPGISEEFLPQLFTRFAQSKSAETKNTGGTGLGLHVSKLIVDAHHGEIIVIRHNPGCEFVLRLNKNKEAAPDT